MIFQSSQKNSTCQKHFLPNKILPIFWGHFATVLCLISLSVADNTHQSEPLSQSISHPMEKSSAKLPNKQRDTQLAAHFGKDDETALPKPLCGYYVPACCHGNVAQDSSTRLWLPHCLSFILLLSTPPGSPLTFVSHAPMSQSSFFRRCGVFHCVPHHAC